VKLQASPNADEYGPDLIKKRRKARWAEAQRREEA
jgi:hypothetical protein